MNPRSLTRFLKSKFGLFVIFVAVLFTGLWFYSRHQAGVREAEKLAAQSRKKVELGQMRMPLNQGLENGLPQQVRPAGESASEKPAPGNGIVPFRPAVAATAEAPGAKTGANSRPAPKQEPKPRKIRVASLLASYDTASAPAVRPEPQAPERFIPFGTLLKCKLVNTVDSANLETPVIALLLEDVWQNGKLVIPANTLVHGMARAGRLRDRVTANGSWRFVWQDGRELPFHGVALDREYDHEVDGYGITDGSGGIKGRLMSSDDLQELKLLAASALSALRPRDAGSHADRARHDDHRLGLQRRARRRRRRIRSLRPAHAQGHRRERLLRPRRRREGILRLRAGSGRSAQS